MSTKSKNPPGQRELFKSAKIASQSQFRETASRGTLRVPQSSAIHLNSKQQTPPDHPAAFEASRLERKTLAVAWQYFECSSNPEKIKFQAGGFCLDSRASVEVPCIHVIGFGFSFLHCSEISRLRLAQKMHLFALQAHKAPISPSVSA